MARCTAWRYRGTTDVARILPVGHDHTVWMPCRERVAARGDWCQTCIGAIILCPSVEVRRAIFDCQNLTAANLQDLSTDPDYDTHTQARARLSARS